MAQVQCDERPQVTRGSKTFAHIIVVALFFSWEKLKFFLSGFFNPWLPIDFPTTTVIFFPGEVFRVHPFLIQFIPKGFLMTFNIL